MIPLWFCCITIYFVRLVRTNSSIFLKDMHICLSIKDVFLNKISKNIIINSNIGGVTFIFFNRIMTSSICKKWLKISSSIYIVLKYFNFYKTLACILNLLYGQWKHSPPPVPTHVPNTIIISRKICFYYFLKFFVAL